jgi:hypothetical protein
MLGLSAGEGMLVSEFLVGGTLSSTPPGRRHSYRNQQDNRQQTAAKHFILSPNPQIWRTTNGFLITNGFDFLRLRAAARRLTGDVNIEAISRAQFVSKSRSSWVSKKATTKFSALKCPGRPSN